jgi:hypothetical protein
LLALLLVVHVALKIVLELGTETSSVLLNKVSGDEWEVIVLISLVLLILQHFLLHVFVLDLSIVVNKILINSVFTHLISLFLEFFKFSNMGQKFLFLLALDVVMILTLFHLFSHLFEMLFHDHLAIQLGFIVDLFTEFDNIGWINKSLKISITHLSDTLVLHGMSLRIWIGHMERSLV